MLNTTMTPDSGAAYDESSLSAVSWAAVIAGAVASAALSFSLYLLGAGLGLGLFSPWSSNGGSAESLGLWAAGWIIFVQIVSLGIGGYLAGRLRTKWVSSHTDEVYFRDTAHGMLVWAVGAIISAMMFSSALSSVTNAAGQIGGSVVQAAGSIGGSAAQAGAQIAGQGNRSGTTDVTAYFTDMLFRSDKPVASGDANTAQAQGEVGRILARGVMSGDVSQPDQAYLAQVVAARTGLSPADAQKRVADVIAQSKTAAAQAADTAKNTAETARKVASYTTLWIFVSLLIGAFTASYMATVGGRLRDDAPVLR